MKRVSDRMKSVKLELEGVTINIISGARSSTPLMCNLENVLGKGAVDQLEEEKEEVLKTSRMNHGI